MTKTKSSLKNICNILVSLSQIEQKKKKIHEIENDENWINVMLEELNKFKRNELQELDYGPYNQSTVGTN